MDAPSPRSLVPFVPVDLDRIVPARCCRATRSGGSRRPPRCLAAPGPAAAARRLLRPARRACRWSDVPLTSRRWPTPTVRSRTGHAVTVYVHGSSGMGKTALVRHFLQTLPQRRWRGGPLSGRCFERESVPYKALDSIVDALSEHLRHLRGARPRTILPRDILALARVFPVLRRVDAIVESQRRVPRDPRFAGAAPPRLRGLSRAADAARRPAIGRALHRRPAMGRRRQRGAARGAAAQPDAPPRAADCHVSQRGGAEQRGAAPAAAGSAGGVAPGRDVRRDRGRPS